MTSSVADLVEMGFNIYEQVLFSAHSQENKNTVFVTLEYSHIYLYIYIGSGPSSTLLQ